jgi:hypothetical protein
MTVNELIEQLKQYPGYLTVMVPGYEFGMEELKVIRKSKVNLNVWEDSYAGPHEESDKGELEVLIIDRTT